ncbi:MAG: polysaccharide deacetylase family protein [Eubacterium sp.]|nr:polysaccharide deacetylase family protein [Eubacterium sp.]
MKKIIIAAMCAALLLAGCSANKEEATTQPESKPSESKTNVADTTVEATGLGSKFYSTEKVVWGPGRADNHQRPTDPVTLQESYGDLGSQFIMSDDKFICLTFDEGYENGYTPAILDTLKEKGVKAIFFVTYDFVKDNPELIERMIDEGHIIGNHTYRHYTMDEVSEADATEEIVFLDKYMKENFKYRMTLFRFPKGEFSENTLALANSLGYKSIFWSFAYADWDTENPVDKEEAFNTITSYTHNGEIMLLHAVSRTNAEILGDVIDEVRNQGYEFTVEV